MMLALIDRMLPIYILLVAHLLLLQQRCIGEGVLHCVCTTAECRRERVTSCQAKLMCYEQRTSGAGEEQAWRSPGVIRGCIDSNTPLLCRNPRPNWFTGSWPLLRCCAEDWCNRAGATEAASGNGQNGDAGNSDDNDEYYDEYISAETSADDRGQRNSVAVHPKKTSPPSDGHRQMTLDLDPCGPSSTDRLSRKCPYNSKSTQSSLNLLFVLVPVSGACALLAICASAFVILKRGGSEGHKTAGANPFEECGYVNGGRLNVMERDELQRERAKDAFDWQDRNYKRSSVSDARKNSNDPNRASRTYIESRIFAA